MSCASKKTLTPIPEVEVTCGFRRLKVALRQGFPQLYLVFLATGCYIRYINLKEVLTNGKRECKVRLQNYEY